jgi:hypothetical protein
MGGSRPAARDRYASEPSDHAAAADVPVDAPNDDDIPF